MASGGAGYAAGSQGIRSRPFSTGPRIPVATPGLPAGGGLKAGAATQTIGAGGTSREDQLAKTAERARGPQTPDAMESLYKDILASHQNAWSGIQSGVQANTALNQRRMAAMNASAGRSMGGAFFGGQAQAFLGGQQNLLNAQLQHEAQGRQIQMDWLDKQLQRDERQKDREWTLAGEESGVPTAQSTTGGAGSSHPALPSGSTNVRPDPENPGYVLYTDATGKERRALDVKTK